MTGETPKTGPAIDEASELALGARAVKAAGFLAGRKVVTRRLATSPLPRRVDALLPGLGHGGVR